MTTPAASGLELPDVREQFTEWLAREMPAGTVISDPRWWAPKIIRAFHDYRSIAQAALAAQPTPTMWNALNGNDPMPTPAQPADIALAVGDDLYKALERRAVFAKCIQGDLLAIPLLTTLALVSDANKRNPNPVAWQVRHFFAGGYWSGWAQAPSEDEAKAVVDRHAKVGTQAEYRCLYDAPAQPAPGVGGVSDLLEQLRGELAEDKGWDYTEYERGRLAEKERVISQLSTRPAESVAQGGCGKEDDMLPEALVPHAKEWYRLCERRFAVDKIMISGELAEAIVEAMGRPRTPTPATGSGGDEGLLNLIDLIRTGRDGTKYDYVITRSNSMVNVAQLFAHPAPAGGDAGEAA